MSSRYQDNQREMNVALNEKEFREGREKLFSTPAFVTLGTHNACNAKCTFCLEGKYSRFNLQLYKEFFEAKMGHFIRNAKAVTFTGFGEILYIPGIEEFLDYLNETLPHTLKVFTTNGTPLTPAVRERILKGNYSIQVSLHASNAELHEKLTLLHGQFDSIIANIKDLVVDRQRRPAGTMLGLVLVNVLTTDNIHDLPDFIRMAWELGAPQVRCLYMTLFSDDHIRMSCFFDQERANRSLREARALIENLNAGAPGRLFRVELPPPFGEKAPQGKQVCSDPWRHFYAELEGATEPCCFWGEHSGNLKQGDDVDALWNGRFYRDLRRGMSSGRPHPWCRNCVKRNGYNVNDVLCHLTNRPEQQKRLLEEIRRRGLEAGKPEKLREAAV